MTDKMSPKEYLIFLRETQSKPWREIAKLPEFKGIPPGSLCAFYKGTWEPKDNKVRYQLGLPQIITSVVHRNNLGRFTEIEK